MIDPIDTKGTKKRRALGLNKVHPGAIGFVQEEKKFAMHAEWHVDFAVQMILTTSTLFVRGSLETVHGLRKRIRDQINIVREKKLNQIVLKHVQTAKRNLPVSTMSRLGLITGMQKSHVYGSVARMSGVQNGVINHVSV